MSLRAATILATILSAHRVLAYTYPLGASDLAKIGNASIMTMSAPMDRGNYEMACHMSCKYAMVLDNSTGSGPTCDQHGSLYVETDFSCDSAECQKHLSDMSKGVSVHGSNQACATPCTICHHDPCYASVKLGGEWFECLCLWSTCSAAAQAQVGKLTNGPTHTPQDANEHCGTIRWGGQMGFYVLGASGTRNCSGCGEKVTSASHCQDALLTGPAALGLTNNGMENNWWGGTPGCHIEDGSSFQWNNNENGQATSGHTPVCSTAPSPAHGVAGCPGNPSGTSQNSGGCCHGAYYGWCSDNYQQDYVCINNACGNDDCCVPPGDAPADPIRQAITTWIVIGTVIPIVIGGTIISIVVFCVMKQRARHRRATQQIWANQPQSTAASGVAMAQPPSVPVAHAVMVPLGAPTAVVPVAQAQPTTGGDPVARLETLKSMLDRGLITQQDFDVKKGALLAEM